MLISKCFILLFLGCGYSLPGQRFSFSEDPERQDYLMGNASGQLYYIDEGEVLGPIDINLLMGGLEPADHSPTNPLTKVQIAQSFYSALVPEGIVKRVQNCNRPGGPIEITVEDAEEVLYQFKKSFEETWSRGWDSTNTEDEVQFVGFFDGKLLYFRFCSPSKFKLCYSFYYDDRLWSKWDYWENVARDYIEQRGIDGGIYSYHCTFFSSISF